MKQLTKRLLSMLFVALLTRTGLDAAPRQPSTGKNTSPPKEESYAQSKTADHVHLLKPDVEYEVHVHKYPYKNPTPELYKHSMLDLLKYLEKQFHFISVVDKDDALATDLVDDSWNEWLEYIKQILPIITKFKVDANEIEDPAADAPSSIWDSFWNFMLKRIYISDKDRTDVDGDGEGENDINVYYGSLKMDPFGKLANMALDAMKQYSGYDALSKWWDSTKKEFQKYITNPEEVIFPEEDDPAKEGVAGGGGVVAFPIPAGVLSISKYNPVSLGVNTLLYILWHSIFWGAYLPYSGIENLFSDYYDYYDDYYDDDEEGADGAPAEEEEEGAAVPAEEGDEAIAPAEEEEGAAPPAEDGGDDGGGRIDSYSSYSYPEYNEFHHEQQQSFDSSHFKVFSSKTGRAPSPSVYYSYYGDDGSPPSQSNNHPDGGGSQSYKAHQPYHVRRYGGK